MTIADNLSLQRGTFLFKDLSRKADFYKIVNLTLYQVLNNLYQISLLESFKKLSTNPNIEISILSSPPELFNFIDINNIKKKANKKIVVLYPDPPLGIEELNILNELDDSIKFLTPITFEL